jgi:hypothetical protein
MKDAPDGPTTMNAMPSAGSFNPTKTFSRVRLCASIHHQEEKEVQLFGLKMQCLMFLVVTERYYGTNPFVNTPDSALMIPNRIVGKVCHHHHHVLREHTATIRSYGNTHAHPTRTHG